METPRHEEDDPMSFDDDPDDETARAYRAIQEQLQQWTSPRLTETTGWTNVGFDGDDDDGLVVYNKKSKEAPVKGVNQTPASYPYERNVMDWWNRELVDPAPKDDDDDEDLDELASAASSSKFRMTATTPPKARTPQTRERAATPVMSNSSKKRSNSKYVNPLTSPLLRHLEEASDNADGNDEDNDSDAMDEEEEVMPVNVQSPWVPAQEQQQQQQQTPHQQQEQQHQQQQKGGLNALYSSNTPRAISPYRNQQYEYRRYHDALLTFLKARRNLSDRIGMDREEQALSIMAQEDQEAEDLGVLPSSNTGDPKLAEEETMAELIFLRTLKSLCWERDPIAQHSQRDWASRREGNLWALLQELRQLGFAALLWANDDASVRQNMQARSAFWDAKAAEVHASPKELVDGMSSDDAPLLLKRRKQLLKWMEHCLDQLVPAETRASVSLAGGDDAKAILSNIGSSNRHLEKVMQSCLTLVLAGRLQDARVLLRKSGHPCIAAKLVGGVPAGIENVANEQNGSVERLKVGNVNRPLWKRQMWKLSEKLSSGHEASPEEAAIHSILANDYRNAIDNQALRSWEKSLYALLHAIWGRSEDELLHLHNNNRRRLRPPFPGTHYLKHEQEQLQATSQLANMTEWEVLEMLNASPFEEMKGSDPRCRAIASILVGQSALTDFLHQETSVLTSGNSIDDEPDNSIARLRLVTHLLLYLDSLSACTTPVVLDGIAECKDQALFAYVKFLANREDLWHFLVLYASLLPEQVLLEYFPSILVEVEGEEERRMMIQQARDLFPGNGLDLVILRDVIRLIFADGDPAEEQESDLSTPTRSDVRKMKAIQWLSFYEEHLGDALVAANMLLRQFLLANKFASANMLVQDFLPDEVFAKVLSGSIEPPKQLDEEDAVVDDELYQLRIGQARAEHTAFQSYLKAIRSMDEWGLVLSTTPVSEGTVDDQINTSSLNEVEQGIAKSMEKRELVRQKRKTSEVVIAAAETARKDMMTVLRHDGGWLADNDEDVGRPDNTQEGQQRKHEIHALRSRLLPHGVKLFHRVCQETASWMWSSLLNSTPALADTPKEALDVLDDGTWSSEGKRSPLSPKYWTQHALHLAEHISSEEYLVMKAFEASDLKEMLTKMSDIALEDLMYSA